MANSKAWFRAEKDLIRKQLFKYTRRAFDMIPRANRQRILDIGCGSGVSAIELAKLAECKITCIDNDPEILAWLREKIESQGLASRIEVLELSIPDMNFPDNTFDVLLAEGSIFAVGFGRGLLNWKRFLKPGGFMIIHDAQGEFENKIRAIKACGYELRDFFLLGSDIWKDEYFLPLDKLVKHAQLDYGGDPELVGLIEEAEREMGMFRDDPLQNSSVCFIIRKKD